MIHILTINYFYISIYMYEFAPGAKIFNNMNHNEDEPRIIAAVILLLSSTATKTLSTQISRIFLTKWTSRSK